MKTSLDLVALRSETLDGAGRVMLIGMMAMYRNDRWVSLGHLAEVRLQEAKAT